MSQIQTGTVAVTNNNASVIASPDNDWSDAATALGNGTPVFWSLIGDLEIPRQVLALTPPNESVSGNWELTLLAPWDGDTYPGIYGATEPAGPAVPPAVDGDIAWPGVAYIIHKDYTPNLNLPIFSPQDRQTAQLMARLVEILDSYYPLVTRVQLAADLSPSIATTLVDAVGLALPVVLTPASAVQPTKFFSFTVVWRTATATTGIKLGLTVPANALYAATVSGIGIGADGTANEFTGALSSSGDSVIIPSAEAINTDYVAEIRGIIQPTAAGALQVQFAAEVAAAGNVTIRKGSMGQYLLPSMGAPVGTGGGGVGAVIDCDQINIGANARFVKLANGIKLEVLGTSGWQNQQQWVEA